MNQFTLRGLAIAAALTLAACSHTPAVQEFAATASPAEETQKLDTDLNDAIRAQVDILSPANFEGAKAALKEAKDDLDKQKDSGKTLHQVALGRAFLNQANTAAQAAHSNFDDIITARQQAIVADAQKHYDKEFATADRNFREVTKDAEKNDFSPVMKNREKLQNQYLAIELLSIRSANLGEAQNVIDQAVKEGAKNYAPRSLALAFKDYKDTEAFITANRHDDQVKTKAATTLASAKHLLKITRDAKGDKKASPEELALQMEAQKNQVAAKDSELQTKEGELANKNSELNMKDTELSGKDAQLSGAALALQQSNEKANSEKEFNQKYETARAQFNDNEAEVYKQGDALVIRLKALDFPKAKADLKGKSFSLLAKVQKVIKSFGESSVVVEGHTDSVGGKAANEKLSTARAEAVREYFISNSVADPSKITAVGYDFQKPLASNKTASGRAQNRRVDIRIQPEKSTSM